MAGREHLTINTEILSEKNNNAEQQKCKDLAARVTDCRPTGFKHLSYTPGISRIYSKETKKMLQIRGGLTAAGEPNAALGYPSAASFVPISPNDALVLRI